MIKLLHVIIIVLSVQQFFIVFFIIKRISFMIIEM